MRGIDRLLYFRLQLEIEFYAKVGSASLFNVFGFFQIGTIDLTIVLCFARLNEAVISALLWREFARRM